MATQIMSDNMELSASMKVLAEQKLASLMAHIDEQTREEATIRVVMNTADDHIRLLVKVVAIIDGKTYVGDEIDSSLESALIRAVAEVNKQYLKDKDKSKERDYSINRDLKRFDGEDPDTSQGA